MEAALALTVGGLFATGTYLMLQRGLFRLALGLALLNSATNLLVFTAAGLVRGRAPIIPEGRTHPLLPVADPLPQALILTSITIDFGMLAFALVLLYRAHQAMDTDDVDELREPEL
jgi:multicomponent Na+:H+ antiporter subunit C